MNRALPAVMSMLRRATEKKDGAPAAPLAPGTVMVFDELSEWGATGVYDNWAEGEWRALREWMRNGSREITGLSRDRGWAAAVRVTV